MGGNHAVFDRFIDASSPLHELDARVKLLLMLTVVLALALLPFGQWAVLALFAVAIWAAVYVARIGLLTTMHLAG